jgi:hypothetical protein
MAKTAPTQEQVRIARHTGFQNSLKHMPNAAFNKVFTKYQEQDARRQKNVSGFVNQIRSATKK